MTAAALILAAGRSSRFGSDKLNAHFRGKPLLEHVVDAAVAAGLSPIVVVVAPDRKLDLPDVKVVVNPDPSRGLSSSLQVGLAEFEGERVDQVVVLLADQPLVSPATIALLLAQQTDRPILVPRYANRQAGNPVVLGRAAWPLAAQLSGDRGMVQLFDRHPALVCYLDVPGTNPDIDAAADLSSLEARHVVAASYDALAQRYVEWSSQLGDPVRQRMVGELLDRLPPGAAVLDLGCGPGLPSTKQLARNFDVTGLDISAAQLELARQNVPEADFVLGDMVLADFPAASFDGVSAFYSLIHVPRVEHSHLFKKLSRWLRPGGLLLATLSATDSPDWTGEWLGEEMFFSGFEAETNRQLLADAGLEILIDKEVEISEPQGPARFQWILARVSPTSPAAQRPDIGGSR